MKLTSALVLASLSIVAVADYSRRSPLPNLYDRAVGDGTSDHWVLTTVPSIAVARIDPIISPGTVGGHVHNILGASVFNSYLNSPAEQQDATCTSAIVGADRSNYWAPMLYFIQPNGSYQAIPSQHRIYYFIKGTDVKPFPPGLRMISGLSQQRNISAIQSQGVAIGCDEGLQSMYLPNTTACTVIQMGIYFPSCGWANQSLDSEDHFSHMTWPIDDGGGETWINVNTVTCPDSHPIKYPTIFLQHNYYPTNDQVWRENDLNVIISTGDTLGPTYHGDFVNGWDQTVLSEAISQCGPGHGPGETLSLCAPFVETLNETRARECMIESMVPDEAVGYYRPLDKLPGCNLLWTEDIVTKPTCSHTTTPGWVGPNVYWTEEVFDDHIPLAVPDAINMSNLPIPAVGLGASLNEWGTFGFNADKVIVGTTAQIDSNIDSNEYNDIDTLYGIDVLTYPATVLAVDTTTGGASSTATADSDSVGEIQAVSIVTSATTSTSVTVSYVSTSALVSASAATGFDDSQIEVQNITTVSAGSTTATETTTNVAETSISALASSSDAAKSACKSKKRSSQKKRIVKSDAKRKLKRETNKKRSSKREPSATIVGLEAHRRRVKRNNMH